MQIDYDIAKDLDDTKRELSLLKRTHFRLRQEHEALKAAARELLALGDDRTMPT